MDSAPLRNLSRRFPGLLHPPHPPHQDVGKEKRREQGGRHGWGRYEVG